eukprot:jgi/Ulvmu1/5306/UM022_0100.1
MAMIPLVTMLSALPLIAGLPQDVSDSPSFCHGLDCPKFRVVEKTDEYELRSYEAGAWVSTEQEGYGYEEAVRKGFWKLFSYIGGSNEAKEKIAMTAPVRTKISAGAGPFCKDHFKISFFVPFKYQPAPPSPTDSTVFVDPTDAFDVYVSSFSGWNTVQTITEHAMELYHVLKADDIEAEQGYFYSVGYDSPFRLLDRHNEVWIVKTPDDTIV